MTIFHQETHFFSLKSDMIFGNDVFCYVFLYQKQVSFFHVPVPSYANLTNSLPILEPSHPPKMSLSLSGLDVDARSNDSAEVPWAARNDLQELQISEKWWVKSPQISH